MLLLSLIHLNNSAAIVYCYVPRETFIFSELSCVLYPVQHSSALNDCLHSTASYMHSTSHPNCSSMLQFLLPFSLYLMLFKLSALSFPSASAVCVCWRTDGLNPWFHSLFPESFTETNLSDHFILQSCHRLLSLSVRLELIQDLGRC